MKGNELVMAFLQFLSHLCSLIPDSALQYLFIGISQTTLYYFVCLRNRYLTALILKKGTNVSRAYSDSM